MSNWKKVKLEDICINITDGVHNTVKDTINEQYYLLSCKNIKNGNVCIDKHDRTIGKETLDRLRKRTQLSKGDVLLSSVGTIGETAIVKEEYPPYEFQRSVAIFKPDKRYITSKFLFYSLNNKKKVLQSMAEGAVQQCLFINPLKQFQISIPPLDEQKKIAGILSALDDKIELNNKINRNLEAQAQAIFKSWFIDFEPFKGSMPSKWHYGNFSEIINSIIGGDWGKDSPTEAYIKRTYCIRGADIPSVKMGNKGKIPFRYILDKNYQIKQLQINDIVVEISGGSPTQSTGRCVQITQALLDRYDSSLICTNFCRAIKPQENYSSFVYHYLQYLYNSNIFFLYENGTTGIKNLDLNSFLVKEQIIVPSIDDVVKFNQIVCDISDVIYANSSENEKLAQLRDTLLPKLMSSEVDISNIAV